MSDGPATICSACAESYIPYNETLPANGWTLPYQLFGYCDGFSDDVGVLLGNQDSQQWIFCHDCIVKFLDTFPLLRASFDKGQHLCESETPCCDLAWRGTELFGKYENRHPVAGVHVQYGESGQWVDGETTIGADSFIIDGGG